MGQYGVRHAASTACKTSDGFWTAPIPDRYRDVDTSYVISTAAAISAVMRSALIGVQTTPSYPMGLRWARSIVAQLGTNNARHGMSKAVVYIIAVSDGGI